MFTLTIRTDNAAFDDDPVPELVKLLAEVAAKLEAGTRDSTVRDLNGNTVGEYRLTPD
jgi:hypothetical protein